MVRALGGLLGAGAALGGWLGQRAERRRRMDTLWALSSGLSRMAEAVRVARTPVPGFLERGGGESFFFRRLGPALAAGEGAEAAWRRLGQDVRVPREERVGVAEAASGVSGVEAQVCRALSAAAEGLRRSLEAERAASMEREKRSAALWLSAGALLVILLI